MQNTKSQTLGNLSSFELDKALLRVADLFDRAVCKYVLLGETAKSVRAGQLTGACIDIGVRERHLAQSTKGILKMIIDNLDETGKQWSFALEGVPVRMKVIKTNNKYITNPNPINYKYDDYMLPNPFEGYYKHRGLLR